MNSISGTYKELYFNIFKNKLQTLQTKQIDKILTHCNPVFENKVYKTDNKKNKINNIIANIITMRDEIGKANIHGTLQNTWMITEAAYAPYLFDVTVAGKKTYLTKGTWELKNDFMAGPFVNYAIKDTKNNRYLILEGFTYNPSKSKRDLVFELEAIIQSVKFLK